jgi:hypothetical protein
MHYKCIYLFVAEQAEFCLLNIVRLRLGCLYCVAKFGIKERASPLWSFVFGASVVKMGVGALSVALK